jgi:hypothetical protein
MYAHTHAHNSIPKYNSISTSICTDAYSHAHTQAATQACTHTRMHTLTHTRTYVHTHARTRVKVSQDFNTFTCRLGITALNQGRCVRPTCDWSPKFQVKQSGASMLVSISGVPFDCSMCTRALWPQTCARDMWLTSQMPVFICTSCSCMEPYAHAMSFQIRKFENYKKIWLCPSHLPKVFLLLAHFNFRPIHNKTYMISYIFVHKENGNKLSSCTQFIVCCSAPKHTLNWNLYIYNWSKQ